MKLERGLMRPVNLFQKDIGWPVWVLGLLGYVLLVWFAFSVVGNQEHGIPPKLEEAARDLYANEWETFRRVTLPLVAPGIGAARKSSGSSVCCGTTRICGGINESSLS